jgi:hypothetical protein
MKLKFLFILLPVCIYTIIPVHSGFWYSTFGQNVEKNVSSDKLGWDGNTLDKQVFKAIMNKQSIITPTKTISITRSLTFENGSIIQSNAEYCVYILYNLALFLHCMKIANKYNCDLFERTGKLYKKVICFLSAIVLYSTIQTFSPSENLLVHLVLVYIASKSSIFAINGFNCIKSVKQCKENKRNTRLFTIFRLFTIPPMAVSYTCFVLAWYKFTAMNQFDILNLSKNIINFAHSTPAFTTSCNYMCILQSLKYMIIGCLMCSGLAFIFLMLISRFVLSVFESTINDEAEGNKFIGTLCVYAGTWIVIAIGQIGWYTIPWLFGFIISIMSFSFASNSTEGEVVISLNRMFHKKTIATLISIDRFFMSKLSLQKKDKNINTVSSKYSTSMKINLWLNRTLKFAIATLNHAINPPRQWLTAGTQMQNKDVIAVSSIYNVLNFLLFVTGIITNIKILVLFSSAFPIFGLLVGLFGVNWNHDADDEAFTIISFMNHIFQPNPRDILFRGRLTNKKICFFCLTFHSLTFGILTFFAVMSGICCLIFVTAVEYLTNIIQRAGHYFVFENSVRKGAMVTIPTSIPTLTQTTAEKQSDQLVMTASTKESKETVSVVSLNPKQNSQDLFVTNGKNNDPSISQYSCIVCWSDMTQEHGVLCAEKHFTCSECLCFHAESTFPNPSKLDPRRMKSIGCKDGRLRCPKTLTNSCNSEPYGGVSLLKLNASNLMRVINARSWATEQAMYEKKTIQFSKSLHDLKKKFKIKKKLKQDRDLLSEQIQREIPNARQCAKCNYGPIDHGWCDNLKTHHGETKMNGGKINNGCPKCGWFANHIKDWPAWNGRICEDVDVSTARKKKKRKEKKYLSPLTDDLQELVRQGHLTEAQARTMMPTLVDESDDDELDEDYEDEAEDQEEQDHFQLLDRHYKDVTVTFLMWMLFYAPWEIISTISLIFEYAVWFLGPYCASAATLIGITLFLLSRPYTFVTKKLQIQI